MTKIKFYSVCGWKVAESDQFCGSCGTKRVNLEKDDRIEITATTKTLKDFLQAKRKDRQKFSLPRKFLSFHKIRSDAKPSHKRVDTSFIIEVGIMDISKENLEPVRGSRLPVKVGKDMKKEEIVNSLSKNIKTMTSFSQTWSNMCCCIQTKN